MIRHALKNMCGPSMKPIELLTLGPRSVPLHVVMRRGPELCSCMIHSISDNVEVEQEVKQRAGLPTGICEHATL